MTEQFLQLSTLTLAGFPTTSLRTQYLSILELRNLFLLVADIFRKISFLLTKIQTYVTKDNKLLNVDNKTLAGQESTTANSRLPQWGATWLNQVLCFYQSLCLVDSFVLRNPPLRQAANRCMQTNQTP